MVFSTEPPPRVSRMAWRNDPAPLSLMLTTTRNQPVNTSSGAAALVTEPQEFITVTA